MIDFFWIKNKKRKRRLNFDVISRGLKWTELTYITEFLVETTGIAYRIPATSSEG
jgi:hypothetical protein